MVPFRGVLSNLVAVSVSATVKAGEIIRDVMKHGSLNMVHKGYNDVQTEADRSAQRCIMENLQRKFPTITIIGEEEISHRDIPQNWIVHKPDKDVLDTELPQHLKDVDPVDITVWIDPLDGTFEYTRGLVEHVTVLVGIAIKGKAVAGVIHQPYYKNSDGNLLGRTLWGIDGAGHGGFTPIIPPQGKKIITTTRSHSDGNVQAAIDALCPDEVVRVGGAGHKVILLLEGKAHAYVFASGGCKRWDTCAPEAVLHAIGGTLTDVFGEHYSYGADTHYPNKRGVLATAPGQSHQWYLDHIPEEVKQALS